MHESDANKVVRLRKLNWSNAKILSALGHPGYGEGFAGIVVESVALGENAFSVIERAL